jgi:hypothetical protein
LHLICEEGGSMENAMLEARHEAGAYQRIEVITAYCSHWVLPEHPRANEE